MVDKRIVDDYKTINNKLLMYNWFVSPYYTNTEFDMLKKFAISSRKPKDIKDKKTISQELASELMQPNLNYHFRAVIIYEGYRKAPHLAKLSHFIEMGLFEFYSLNFMACLGIWIPTVEGIMRSLLGIEFGMYKLSEFKKEFKKLKAKIPQEHDFLDAIIQSLFAYFSEVFFKSINERSELTLDNFNRHLFGHGIPGIPQYCRDNCVRLLNVFDSLLAIDFITTKGFRTIFDPDSESLKKIKKREQYYQLLVGGSLSDIRLYRIELLNDHHHFDEQFYFGR